MKNKKFINVLILFISIIELVIIKVINSYFLDVPSADVYISIFVLVFVTTIATLFNTVKTKKSAILNGLNGLIVIIMPFVYYHTNLTGKEECKSLRNLWD